MKPEEVFSGNISTALDLRNDTYGSFRDVARLHQNLKGAFYSYMIKHNEARFKKLTYVQIEVIEMNFLKLSRIACGDPDYIDNWIDIAGYAMLAAKELEEKKEFDRQKSNSNRNTESGS